MAKLIQMQPFQRPNKASSYSAEWLQYDRPQPMYDKKVHRLYEQIFATNPADNPQLLDQFKDSFLGWLNADKLNRITGIQSGFHLDACIGCTHFIDDLYQTIGRDQLMIFSGDYKYHWRLNQNIRFYSLETLTPGKHLIIAMPFPAFGDIHPNMNDILDRCLELKIPVHIDGAWLSCSRDISFDFAHPAIHSFAISLSKGMGTGGNRIGLRFARERIPGPITLMNDFNMNCQSLLHIGIKFMQELGSNYFWNKYGDAYEKICRDFQLKPTKAIHLAMSPNGPVGVRLLLRWLNDR